MMAFAAWVGATRDVSRNPFGASVSTHVADLCTLEFHLGVLLTYMVIDGAWAGKLGAGGQGIGGVCFTVPVSRKFLMFLPARLRRAIPTRPRTHTVPRHR